MSPVPDRSSVQRFLAALFAGAPDSAFIDVRFRRGDSMGQSFHRVSAIDGAVEEIVRRAGRTDVFVGVLPRARRGGSRQDLFDRGDVVWVDCDDESSTAALEDFRPAPSMVVASGSPGHRHAYWLLDEPVPVAAIESVNVRFARALSADLSSSEAARILRPAGSLWHKAAPTLVRRVSGDEPARHAVDDVLGALADAPAEQPPSGRRGAPRRREGDPLLQVAPAEYVQRLTGQPVGRDRKVRCPFHDDQTPSLHVFTEPERGWFCFGCRRGGSIYDFAALLWDAQPRGPEFVALRDALKERMPTSS